VAGAGRESTHLAAVPDDAADPIADRPLVSVCISAYNVERFLEEALTSIVLQTYSNLEIIVVDNGSVDKTFEIASTIGDERLSCFRLPENIGGYQAMNLVSGRASGDLVAIYHSDDVYEPTMVEREVAYLQSHADSAAVFTMCSLIDENGTPFGSVDLPAELAGRESVRYDDVFPVMVRKGNFIFPCPSFMIRRSVLAEVGPFDADRWDIAADLEMWLRLTREHRVGILDDRLFRYRVTTQQWTSRWKRQRTTPDLAIEVMQQYFEQDDWARRLPGGRLDLELASLRSDDETTRAANAVSAGDSSMARALLRGRYPYEALLHNFRRRKLRVLLLRALMKTLLALHAGRMLRRVLRRTGDG
jgi:cellulose synthase/poly-beta-1,6-N-acetylglucosamine synthase-like glycosyltransferase